MKRIILMLIVLMLLAIPVKASDFTAPEAPSFAEKYMPEKTESFWDGLWYIIRTAFADIMPEFALCKRICLSVLIVGIISTLLKTFSESSQKIVSFAGVVAVGILLLEPADTLIRLALETVNNLSDYGKLLIPVMTGALAAQGGVTTSTALYAGTVFFNGILSVLVSVLFVPLIYVFVCLSVANSAIGDEMLKKIRDLVKQTVTWLMKIILYVFTGYMSLTGVISGSADAAAIKAAKITISSTVPVIGNILSDASESVLIGTGVIKNAAGIYGCLSLVCIMIGPFLKIGVQYLLLKGTAGVSYLLASKDIYDLLNDFSSAMGMTLAMVGSLCLILLISVVCFMKGVG